MAVVFPVACSLQRDAVSGRRLSLSRRSFLQALLAAAFIGQTRAAPGGTDYSADLEFLLSEFQSKAGHFFEAKKIDWAAVSEQFRQEAKAVSDDVAHVKLCNRLLARLRDGHAGIVSLKTTMPDESKGRRFTGPRVHLVEIGQQVFVRQAFDSARQGGVEIGMEVEAIDGIPIREWMDKTVERLCDERGYSTPHAARYYACHTGLADWAGTPIKFSMIKDGNRREITLGRSGGPNFVPIGPVFPPAKLEQIGRQSFGRTPGGMGYLHLRDIPGDLPAQLDKILTSLAGVPGLILDCRANGGGGCDHEAVFGRFLPAGARWRQYTGAGDHPFGGPMVVIVDAGVRSAGETVAGMFKEDGRAYMIGDAPTAGMSSQKATATVPSGLFTVRFSIGSNKGRFNGGKGIEGIGVPPHELTPYEARDLASGVDTQIRRAEELLLAGLPKQVVPWEAQAGPGASADAP